MTARGEAARIDRQRIVAAVAGALESREWALAAWLGGSDASDRTDAWSDVDLQVIVEDDRVEEAFEIVHAALEALSPIRHRHRFPEPMWHGHSQELLRLRDAEPFHFLDLVVMARSKEERLLEPERHGKAHVLFDREGLLAPAPFDRARHAEKMRRRLGELRELFFLLQNLVTKAVLRRAAPDAVATYIAWTVRPLVELLRMRHCPDRYDFGLRYLDRDLPAELGDEIAALVLPPSLDAVEEYRTRAEELFCENLRALDDGAWSLPE